MASASLKDVRLAAIAEEPVASTSGRPPSPRRWGDQLATCDAALLGAGSQPRVRPLRKCASVPTGLHAMSEAAALGEEGLSSQDGMEVYVVMRPFKEFGGGLFRRLPRTLRNGVRDSGICHYLAVFRQKDGSLVQFDFGPRGGDIHVAASNGPFAFLSKSADGKMARHVPGEVRERRLSRLPEAHMYVGRTPLSLPDIRAWNALQQQGSMAYELHRNDCRHYINCLVQYTTGQRQAASEALTSQWRRARERGTYGPAGATVLRVTQFFTDLANWGKVQLISNVSMYGAMALSGQKALARLKPAALLPGARAKLQPVVTRALAAAPVRRALVRKPVVVGTTAAVATLAAGSQGAPAVKDAVTVGARVAGVVRTAAQATLAAASTAVSSAAAATTRTSSQVAVMAGNLAGAASQRLAAGRGPQLALEFGKSAAASPPRASLALRAVDRSARLALAVTSAARR